MEVLVVVDPIPYSRGKKTSKQKIPVYFAGEQFLAVENVGL